MAKDYLGELDNFINHITQTDFEFPEAHRMTREGEYNEYVTSHFPNTLLLDKKTVRIRSATSSVEICDILTDNGKFIHVKWDRESSSFIHLLTQGYISAELFNLSFEYREDVKCKIIEVEQELANSTRDNGYLGRFSTFDISGISPSSYEIVYAIIGNWKGQSFVETFPLGDKILFRRITEDLRSMGYRVSYKMVQESRYL